MGFLAPILPAFLGGTGAAAGAGAAAGGIGLGTALQVGGSLLGIASAVGASSYQATVARNNAAIAERNAQLASTQAQEQQQQNDQQVAALIGEQEAIQGASGLTGASQLRTRRSTARLGRIDSANIRAQGTQNIQNARQQAENFRSEASAARSQGLASIFSGGLDIASSLVGGASSTRRANRITGSSYDPWVLRSGQNLRRA
jgi:hypothetical protein